MLFADFILRNMEPILEEWGDFAVTLPPEATEMTALALADHAKQILEALATDLATFQAPEAQSERPKGRCPVLTDTSETVAQTHAILRERSDVDINQLVAEYRALRASVIRLWIRDSEPEIGEVIRFDEAIDQVIAESVAYFEVQQERARSLLLGMLGHDMRSPLNSMVMTASYLAALNAGPEVSAAAERLSRCSTSLKTLLDDLEDFNRTKLGLGVKVERSDIDLAAEVADEVEQLRDAHPARRLKLAVAGDTSGMWDGWRMKQVIRNLVSNACQYGSPDAPVRVALRGEEKEVWIEVTNSGPSIDPSALKQIFDPLRRACSQVDKGDVPNGLGLGLFIVREIVNAHGGNVTAHCTEGETAFAVRLPRSPSGAH